MEPESRNTVLLVLAGILFLSCILALCWLAGSGSCAPAAAVVQAPTVARPPVFVSAEEKLKELGDPAFTLRLYDEAVAFEPLLATPGTQVHMGFYSGKGNHGSLLRLIDAVNSAPMQDGIPQRAIWAQGTDDYFQFPSYVRITDEHWYDRANGANGTVTIFGKPVHDPYPVTLSQADAVWSLYSRRFAEMARPIANATGRPVKAWCFVQGAKPNRIFYTSEYVALQQLEREGVIEVRFAKNPLASWDNPADWITGTANAPPPAG